MLDTNIVSAMMRDPKGAVAEKITIAGADAICISNITAAELRYGCAKKGSPKLLERVEMILSSTKVLPLEDAAAAEYGDIRHDLELRGMLIGPNDLLIAAHARSIDAVLVTANRAEFDRVDDLKVENWLS